MDAKFFSTKWGAFADNPNSPLLDMGNEVAWGQMYERELEDFRRRQRAKAAAASASYPKEDGCEPGTPPGPTLVGRAG
jgi:hypothetical protein